MSNPQTTQQSNLFETCAEEFVRNKQYQYAAAHYELAEKEAVGFKQRERLVMSAMRYREWSFRT